MIDCNIIKNYFAEKAKMTKLTNTGFCEIRCQNCPLSRFNNGEEQFCSKFELKHPERAISIVQQWSNTYQQKTYLTELLKTFPNTQLNTNGTPKEMCPHELGLNEIEDCGKTDNACVKCWSQPLPIEDGEG